MKNSNKILLLSLMMGLVFTSCSQTSTISTDNTKENIETKNSETIIKESETEKKNNTGGARVGDIGAHNQKVVLTEIQKELIERTKNKFINDKYEDTDNDVILPFSLYIPTDYDENKSYPLIMFIPDSSAAGKSSEEVLTEYYGADIWAEDKEQEKHPSFVFCPTFTETVVDDGFNTSKQIDTAVKLLNEIIEEYNIDTKRIYTTGQSMGCMTSLYLNSKYPDMFAASLFVSGQWDINVLKNLENSKFFYITCTGDTKASGGQQEVMDMFDKDDIPYSYIENMLPDISFEEKNEQVDKMIEAGNNANFIRFYGLNHMSSFNYAYDLESVRDFIFSQSK